MNQEEFFKRYSYNIRTDKIGGGGFGTVYKATDNLQHRTVAIKVSEVKTAANGKVFSLKDEFNALKGLPMHPNIANYEEFYSFEMPNGLFDYAVMQYYPDGNLSNYIGAKLSTEQKEDLAIQLLEGLCFLHEHKVVHRDLKPGNILVVKHGNKLIPLITDFGLSKAAKPNDRSMFSNSFGGGTPRYSSPEQLNGKPLRFNTDLWSYGAVVYELFAGHPLFEAGKGAANSAEADMEIYNKIIKGDVGKRLQELPEKWSDILERCLVVNPEKRVKNARELLVKLTDMTDPESNKKPTPEPNLNPKPNPNPFPKQIPRWVWLGGGCAIALALIILGATLIIRSNSNQPKQTSSFVEEIDPSDWIPFEQNGKWGFKDTDGNITITAQFDDAWSFSDGRAPIEMDGKYGFIDKTGSIVIPTKYEDIFSFEDGMARVLINNKYGCIDTSGKFIIEAKYVYLDRFYDDMAAMIVNGKKGFINKSGRVVVEPKYETDNSHFHHGVAICERYDDLYDLIDKNGKVLAQYKFIDEFSEGLARVRKDNYKYGYINEAGEMVIPAKFHDAQPFSEGFARVDISDERARTFSYAYINKNGTIMLKPNEITFCADFSEGMAYVHKHNYDIDKDYNYYIDIHGNILFYVEDYPNFEQSFDFHNGLAHIQCRCFECFYPKHGYIDKTGTVVIKPIYDAAGDFSNGLAVVGINVGQEYRQFQYYYIDKNGNDVFGIRFEYAASFSKELDGLAEVKINNKYAFINTKGEIVKYVKR